MNYKNELWFRDVEKLTTDELIRLYNMIKMGEYKFAKNAWYIPVYKDQRCPIMIAKGYLTPDTPKKIVEFEEISENLKDEFRNFVDAWDLNYITESNLADAILSILESKNIKIISSLNQITS